LERKSPKNKILLVPCATCGELAESKNKNYILCPKCMQAYLNSLEEMAKENKRATQNYKIKKEQYHKLYKKIERTKERLVGVPRKLEPLKLYDRNCLRCEKSFVAHGKYNRVCSGCKDIISNIEDVFL
tara:strand:- start:1198 stop:1581 length:384 start_codon:yes stop_codon:yes gene_type:complete